MDEPVGVVLDYPSATIWLNRPQKLNALNLELMIGFEAAVDRVASDESVKIVLVRGQGRSFCSGLDLDMFAEAGMPPTFYQRQEHACHLLETMEQISVAAIQGHCLGGGVQIAIACDLRLAARDAVLGLPAINEALFPGMAPFRLPRLIGKGRAMSLILTGETLSADDALSIGLVDSCADVADFDASVERLANTLTEGSFVAATAAKRLMTLSFGASFSEVLAESEELLEECLRSDEVKSAQARWPARPKRR